MDGGKAAKARYESMEEEFKKKMEEDRRNINTNTISLAREKYQSVISDLLNCRIKNRKDPRDYRLLKRYDILEVDGKQKLIVPMKPGQDEVMFYVSDEEIFDVLHTMHIKLGHGGRDKMMKHLKPKYKNITYKDVKMYLDLCELCLPKSHTEEKDNDLKTVLSNVLCSRSQVDVLDFTTKPDGSYKYVMIYEHLPSKFIILRPLKEDLAEEVADHLIDIFTLFGAPSIIQSNKGMQFSKSVVEELKITWTELKIVYGEGKDKDSEEKTSQNIETALDSWMQINKTTQWSKGLRFVQLKKNRASIYNNKKSPYEVIFGLPIKLGLNTANMPKDIVETANTEEDLKTKINKVEGDTEGYVPSSEVHYIKSEPTDEYLEDYSNDTTNVCWVCNREGADLRKCVSCFKDIHIICGISQQFYEEEEQEVVCFPCSNQVVKVERQNNDDDDKSESKRARYTTDEDQNSIPDPTSMCVPVLDVDRAYGNSNSNREWVF